MSTSALLRLSRRLLPSWARRGVGLVAAILAATIVAAGTASAYWSSAGSSTGQATTGTLTVPVLTAPATSTSTVALSWTASTGTAKSVGYYVTRTGSSTANVCGTPTVPIAALSCSDPGVANGTYSYVVTAVSGTWTAPSSPSSVVVSPVPSKLVITTQPSATATSGTAFATQLVLAIQDSSSNVITSNTSAVTLSLQTAGGATLSCAVNPKPAVAGVVTYSGCSIDKVGSYKLVATLGALTVVSNTITVSPGAAAKLIFTANASDAYAGGVFYVQPAVTIQDAAGNVATSNTTPVTLSITPTAGGAAIACAANPKAAVAGVTTFAGCAINVAGTYTITASDGALTVATDSITITVAPAGLVWSSSSATICGTPTGSSSALVYAGCVNVFLQVGKFTSKVTLVDAGGNAFVNSGADLTVTISAAAGSSSPTTLTIAHGASVSNGSTVFSPGFGLFGPYTDTVTASLGLAGHRDGRASMSESA